MIPVTGFEPSNNPTKEGVITYCTNLVPTNKGMRSVLSGEKIINTPVPEPVLAGYTQKLLSGAGRIFACSGTKIYELLAGNWVNISKTGGYTTPVNHNWRLCQFGDVTIATNGNDTLQFSTISGAFNDLPNAPKAKICESTQGFVMLFNTNDGFETLQDGWWSSGLYDHTAWTPSSQTQSANGRLMDTPGAIIGAKAMAGNIIAYKNKSMYLGEYVAGDLIWSWRQISDNTGSYSHEGIIAVEGAHYFVGDNGFFRYDGSRLEPIGTLEIKEWFKNNINLDHTDDIRGFYDNKNSLIYWYYVSKNQTINDAAIVYHIPTNKFGRVVREITSVVDVTLPNMTWEELGSLYMTWGSYPETMQWNSPVFYGADVGHSYFSPDGYLYKAESGTALYSSFSTGDIGDDSLNSIISRVRVRFFIPPLTGSMTHSYRSSEGAPLVQTDTYQMNDSRFDLTKSARFHKLDFRFTGDVEISSIDPNLIPNGAK
jgi:hypothetical protein